MAKRIYVNAKKEIERLMYEKVNWEAEGNKIIVVDSENSETSNAPVGGGISIWESSFRTSKIFDKATSKLIDFKYTEEAILIQNVLNDGIEKALKVAREINTPDFFDYLLGEVKIEGNFRTYNLKHIQTEKKYFNISQENVKKYYTSKLLLALVNIAPDGSQAAIVRDEAKELAILSFAGVHKNFNGVDGCVFDCNHINNFKSLEKLKIYSPSGIINSNQLKNLPNLRDLILEGYHRSVGNTYSDRVTKKQFLVNETIPALTNLSKLTISDISNEDLSFLNNLTDLKEIGIFNCSNLKSLTGLNLTNTIKLDISACDKLTSLSDLKFGSKIVTDLKEIRIWNCSNLKSLNGLNLTNTIKLDISACDKLTSLSDLKFGSKIETIRLGLKSIDSALDQLSELTSCKKISLSLNDDNDISFIENLENLEELNITSCKFSSLNDLTSLKKLKSLYVSGNLTTLPDISGCFNIKKIDFTNVPMLKSVNNFPKLKCVDISFNGSVGIENLDFLENTQIITAYSKDDFYVSESRSEETINKTGKNLPIGFSDMGYVIPTYYSDGSVGDYINDNSLDLSNFTSLQNLEGLKNVTNIMQMNLSNCDQIKSLSGLNRMLDLREIDLTGCTNLESLHALKKCTKLEKIITSKCNNILPKPKMKVMDTQEKVQEYLNRL